MEYREFISMTDDEIRTIVNDLFKPKKISCIKRHKRREEITCKIYTEWDPEDPIIIADELTLRDPFKNGGNSISVGFSVDFADRDLFKKFCLAKGMVPWLLDNPYLEEEKMENLINNIKKWINSSNRGGADYFIVDKIEALINEYEGSNQ